MWHTSHLSIYHLARLAESVCPTCTQALKAPSDHLLGTRTRHPKQPLRLLPAYILAHVPRCILLGCLYFCRHSIDFRSSASRPKVHFQLALQTLQVFVYFLFSDISLQIHSSSTKCVRHTCPLARETTKAFRVYPR